MGRDEYCWKVCFVWGVEWSGLSGKGRVIGVDGRKGIRSGRVYRVRPVTALWGSAPWGSSSGGDLDGVERTGLGGVGKCSGADFEVDWSQPIATGSFGEVFFGSHIASGVPVVLKQARSVPLAKKLLSTERYVNRKLAATAAARQNQERRRRYWAAYLGEFERRSGTVLVWKREGDGSTLEDYLSRRPIQEIGSLLGAYDYGSGPFRPGLCKALLRHLLAAVADLQDQGLVHRDVKPANLIVARPASSSSILALSKSATSANLGVTDEGAPLQIIDFGSAGDFSSIFKWGLSDATCDPLYAAPELRVSASHPDRFDVFSVGIIGLRSLVPDLTTEPELARFRDHLASRNYDLTQALSDTTNYPWAAQWKDNMIAAPLLLMLTRMLRQRPQDRPSAAQLLQMVQSTT